VKTGDLVKMKTIKSPPGIIVKIELIKNEKHIHVLWPGYGNSLELHSDLIVISEK